MATSKESQASVTIRLANGGGKEVTLCVEPWGELYSIRPGSIFEVTAQGPGDDMLEIETSDDYVTVFGWAGSVVRVFHDGKELGAGRLPKTPVPVSAPDASTRETMRRLKLR